MSEVWDLHKGKIVVGFVGGILAILVTILNLWGTARGSMENAVDSRIKTHSLQSEPRMQLLESKVEDIREEQKEQRVVLDEILKEVKK